MFAIIAAKRRSCRRLCWQLLALAEMSCFRGENSYAFQSCPMAPSSTPAKSPIPRCVAMFRQLSGSLFFPTSPPLRLSPFASPEAIKEFGEPQPSAAHLQQSSRYRQDVSSWVGTHVPTTVATRLPTFRTTCLLQMPRHLIIANKRVGRVHC